MTNDQKIEEVFQNPRRFGLTCCFLCGDHPAFTCALEPNPEFAKRIGAEKGRQHLVFYALCEVCFGLPDRDERTEINIMAKHGLPAGGVQ